MVPTVKTSELMIKPVRRPKNLAMGETKKQPKKAPAWRMETALELTLVFWALVYPKSFWKDSRERTPPVWMIGQPVGV